MILYYLFIYSLYIAPIFSFNIHIKQLIIISFAINNFNALKNIFILKELFGRIISMVLEWFHLVCYIPSDASGELISKVRSNVKYYGFFILFILFKYYLFIFFKYLFLNKFKQFILPWIKTVTENHFELVVSCLVPFPPEFAKVGGIW